MRKQVATVDPMRCRCGFRASLGAESHIDEQRVGSNTGSDQRFAFLLTRRIFKPDVIAAFNPFFSSRFRVDPHRVIPHQFAE